MMRKLKPAQFLWSAALAAAVVLSGCKPATSTDGNASVGNRGRTADPHYSEVTGTNLTSTTASTVTVTLRSKGGAPLVGVIPTISVLELTANDFNFSCGSTNTSGVATCSFRSFDAGTTKTPVVTAPIYKAAASPVTVTRAASQMSLTAAGASQPTDALAAGVANTAVLALLDPLGVAVLTDSSTVVTATLVTNSNTNALGVSPVLQRGVVACSPCTATAAAGVVQFAAGSNFNVNTSGSYSLRFSATGLTSVDSTAFTVVGGTPTQTVFTTQPTLAVAPLEVFAQQPVVKVADAVGNIVSTGACATATIEVSLVGALGTGAVLGSVAEASVAGVASFADNALRIDRTVPSSNTYRLSAVDNPVCNGVALTAGQSSNITVSDVGIPNKLSFGTQPSSSTTTGTVLATQPAVRLLDSAGTLVTNNNSVTVTLDSAGCPNVTIGGTTTRTVVNGIATFNDITLTAVGPPKNCQIGATATGMTGAFSSNVRVETTGVVGTKLAWLAQPTSTGKNQNILAAGPASLTVRVLDSGNNLVAIDNSTRVSITQSPASGTLSGTVTQQVVNGVATFSDLKLNTNGAFALVASAAGLTSATSNSFVINNTGVATALRISTTDVVAPAGPDDYPDAITAGVIFPRGVVVQIVDEVGALVADASGQEVTLSCTSPAGCTLKGFPLKVYALNGIADFHVSGGHSLRIDTPIGNNIVLTATATAAGLIAGSTPGAIVGTAGAVSNAASSVSALCPTATGVGNGKVFIFVKDQFGNPHVGTATDVTLAGGGGCTDTCGSTDSDGMATCNFSCPAQGTISVTVATPAAITQTATCGF